jgi:predicted nucleic acid-binding protein
VATAEPTYVDTSALVPLYLHQRDSAAMIGWRARRRGALPITLQGRIEVVNAICLAAFRREIDAAGVRDALLSFEEDFVAGRYINTDVLWRAALRRAEDLSREHSAELGCRSSDVLHVATALELALPGFLTFDLRQRRLARAVGLKVVALRS